MTTYSFQDVQATLAGPSGNVDLGYGSAVAKEGISLDPTGDRNTMMVGADGKGMHSIHADKSGTIIVRLLKNSPINSQLQAMFNEQTTDPTLHGRNTIIVRQTQSGDIHTATQVAFKRKTSVKYAEVGDVVEWAFDAVELDSVLGTY